MYLSFMNENASRNTPAYVFEIQQLLRHENVPVGTEYAIVAVADRITKKAALRKTLGRILRAISQRESGRINGMELLSLIFAASASPVNPLPDPRIERAMHEILGFILEVREGSNDPQNVDLGAGLLRRGIKLSPSSESMIPEGLYERLRLRGTGPVVLAAVLCGVFVALLVIGFSRHRNEAADVVATRMTTPQSSMSESRPGTSAPIARDAHRMRSPSRSAVLPAKGEVRQSNNDEKREAPSYPAPLVAQRTPALPVGDSRMTSLRATAESNRPSVSSTDRKKVLAGPVGQPNGVPTKVATAVVDPPISAGGSSPVGHTPRGIVQSGSAGIMAANLISSPTPAYPDAASNARVEGEVTVNALVGKDGNVLQATVVSGPPLLREAALRAVERWQYRPYLISGKPAVMATTAIVAFELAHQ